MARSRDARRGFTELIIPLSPDDWQMLDWIYERLQDKTTREMVIVNCLRDRYKFEQLREIHGGRNDFT